MNKRIVSFFFLLLFTGSIYAAIDITDLRTELLKNPKGIDVRQPRLSWRIESDEQNVIQTAYHILVASSPEHVVLNVREDLMPNFSVIFFR